jgi:hypothetical protein
VWESSNVFGTRNIDAECWQKTSRSKYKTLCHHTKFYSVCTLLSVAHTFWGEYLDLRENQPITVAARSKHELSSLAQTLGSWVRIPLEAWMSVCGYSVFVLSCVQVAALRWADPPSKESYRLCKWSWNWKSGQGPTKGCRATDRQIDRYIDR